MTATRENFPVALRILPAEIREDLGALYKFARHVDDVGDEWNGDRTTRLKELAEDVHRLYDGRDPELPVVAGLVPTVRRHPIPREPWLDLISANLHDQEVDHYESFGDLLDYCTLSANPVGLVVLHVFDRMTPERVELSNRVCTGLQLVEHWQDIGEDHARGRVYLPSADMRRFGVDEADLAQPHASPELRALVQYETDRALAYLNSGSVLVSTLTGWARLAISGYVNGGRAAADGLRRSGYDPLPGLAKPTARQIARRWLRETVRSPG
ncbi:MAG TPA: squalene synthase HpnC [Nocardioidaceae bacterium]|nr:squalene synthase HpnC [Nocardioidaceae bacterium]